MSRGQVSVRGDVYARVKEEAEKRGVSISQLVEAALVGATDVPLEDVDRLTPEPQAELEGPPRPFLCASCGNDRYGAPYRLPWGRSGGVVDVCYVCVNDHPRSGRYGFSEAGNPAGGSGYAPGRGRPGSR